MVSSVSDRNGFKIFTFCQAFLKAKKYMKDVYQVWQYKVRRSKWLISSCSRSTVLIENCYYTD